MLGDIIAMPLHPRYKRGRGGGIALTAFERTLGLS